MPSNLLSEWIAYYEMEPFGAEILDAHFAELKAIVLNVNRAKNATPIDPEKLRKWKKLEEFDLKKYYNQLKAALTFKGTEKPD